MHGRTKMKVRKSEEKERAIIAIEVTITETLAETVIGRLIVMLEITIVMPETTIGMLEKSEET
jgi:hypothetical protein